MTDLEITLLCAKAMDYSVVKGTKQHANGVRIATVDGDAVTNWHPLFKRDQAFLLLESLHIDLVRRTDDQWEANSNVEGPDGIIIAISPGAMRAVCECAAQLALAKHDR